MRENAKDRHAGVCEFLQIMIRHGDTAECQDVAILLRNVFDNDTENDPTGAVFVSLGAMKKRVKEREAALAMIETVVDALRRTPEPVAESTIEPMTWEQFKLALEHMVNFGNSRAAVMVAQACLKESDRMEKTLQEFADAGMLVNRLLDAVE